MGLLHPLLAGNIDGIQGLKVCVFFFAAMAVGALIVKSGKFLDPLPELLATGLSILIGGTLLFIAIAVFRSALPVYVITGLFIGALLLSRKISLGLDKCGFAAAMPLLILLLNGDELRLAMSPVYENLHGDFFYFEAIVVSLSETLSIFDSVFHKGFPINYSSLPFFAPSALSFFSGISGHVSYSGIYVPFLKVLSFSMATGGVIQLAIYLRSDAESAPWSQYLLASAALMLLAPLHPLYVAKADPRNFILLGEGYLLPMGNMGFAFSIGLFAASLFYIFGEQRRSVWQTTLFILLVSGIAGGKPAMFMPVIIFYGLIALYRGITMRKWSFLGVVCSSFIAGILVSIVFTGNDGGMAKMYLTLHDGYYKEYYIANAEKFHLSANVSGGVALFIFMAVIWLGYKSIVFLLAWKDIRSRMIILASLGTILVSFLPGWFLKITYVDQHGALMTDASFDTNQFARAGLFISTIMAVALLVNIWQGATKTRLIFRVVTIIWFVAAGTSLYHILRTVSPLADSSWEREVKEEYLLSKPGLLALISTPGHSGQVLVAQNITPWWICCERVDFWGSYLCTNKPNYRNELLKNMLSATDLRHTTEIRDKLKGEGVDALVATPENKEEFARLSSLNIIEQMPGCKWIYQLK